MIKSDGLISSLWCYPVKSLLGEKLDSLDINNRGVVNDRIYAISNKLGKFGSGKNTRRFKRIDGLFSLSSSSHEDGVSITFPDGVVLSNKSQEIDLKLTQFLGQEVNLTREREIPHFDDGSIHILTSNCLAKLQKLLPHVAIDERRFRANIVISTSSNISDDDLVGKTITIGEVKLEVTHKTERCRMITLEQSDLDASPEIVKWVSKNYGLHFGVYASVIKTGTISLGDSITVIST
jgi:uncharacterized protein YcbX